MLQEYSTRELSCQIEQLMITVLINESKIEIRSLSLSPGENGDTNIYVCTGAGLRSADMAQGHFCPPIHKPTA